MLRTQPAFIPFKSLRALDVSMLCWMCHEVNLICQEPSHPQVYTSKVTCAPHSHGVHMCRHGLRALVRLLPHLQAGPLSEAASSRPGSLYQEQVSPLSFAAADLSPLPPAGDGEVTPWRTPSASPSPPATAAAADGSQQGRTRSADATPRRAGRDTGAAAAAAGEVGGLQQHSVGVSPRLLRNSGEGQLPSGFFTPIETRVQSLASKLRVRGPDLHQAGIPEGWRVGWLRIGMYTCVLGGRG
jgi:hypothetical protein